MHPSETFEQAYAAFVPQKDDSIEAIPYYRTYHALKATLNAYSPETWAKFGEHDNFGVIHAITCSGAKTWAEVIRVATYQGFMPLRLPDMPKDKYWISSEPDTSENAVNRRADEIFERNVCKAFPGIRKNTKRWFDKKAQVFARAVLIARSELNEERAKYSAAKAAFDTREQCCKSEWMEKVHKLALALDGLRDIQNLEGR